MSKIEWTGETWNPVVGCSIVSPGCTNCYAMGQDDGGWTKHTDYHWSRLLGGHRLDYWPSRKKWMFGGKVQRGNVQAFIAARSKQ